MVLQKVQRIISLSFLLLMTASAFSARKATELVRSPSSQSPSRSRSPFSSALNAGAVVMEDNDEQDNGGLFLMGRAAACADSETCSLEEAQSYLEDVLMMQKDCLDATIEDFQSPICQNVDTVAEIVANLRSKIEAERLRPVKTTVNAVNVVMGLYVVSTILHGFAAVPNVPVDAPLFTDFDTAAWDVMKMNDRGVATVLPQEWYWALRDGYFPALFSEWFRNGGLVVDMSAFDSKVVAFTPQEWVWSIQNGSIGDLLRENMQYGGYLVDSSFDTEGATPMTGQDVLWSIQGGYFGTAAKHFFRNGGI